MKVYCHRPTVLYQADKDDFFFGGGEGVRVTSGQSLSQFQTMSISALLA